MTNKFMKKFFLIIISIFFVNFSNAQENDFMYSKWKMCTENLICPTTQNCYYLELNRKNFSYSVYKDTLLIDYGHFELRKEETNKYGILFSSDKDKMNSFLDNQDMNLYKNLEKLVMVVKNSSPKKLYVLTKK